MYIMYHKSLLYTSKSKQKNDKNQIIFEEILCAEGQKSKFVLDTETSVRLERGGARRDKWENKTESERFCFKIIWDFRLSF